MEQKVAIGMPRGVVGANQSGEEQFSVTERRPTFKDPYRLQLEHLYEAIMENKAPKTTAEDFKQDLELFGIIVEALRRNELHTAHRGERA